MPLVVMLHACRQDAGDFARGTGMNALAEQHGHIHANRDGIVLAEQWAVHGAGHALVGEA